MTAKVAAKRRIDRKPVKLTIVRGARDEGNMPEQNVTLAPGVTYFDVPANRGSHTLMVTPIAISPRPLWKQLFRL